MFNSKNLGAIIEAETPHVKSWEDGQYNILNMSIEETYGVAMSRQGGPARHEERDGPAERVRNAGSHGVQPGLVVLPATRTLAHAGEARSTDRLLSIARKISIELRRTGRSVELLGTVCTTPVRYSRIHAAADIDIPGWKFTNAKSLVRHKNKHYILSGRR